MQPNLGIIKPNQTYEIVNQTWNLKCLPTNVEKEDKILAR